MLGKWRTLHSPSDPCVCKSNHSSGRCRPTFFHLKLTFLAQLNIPAVIFAVNSLKMSSPWVLPSRRGCSLHLALPHLLLLPSLCVETKSSKAQSFSSSEAKNVLIPDFYLLPGTETLLEFVRTRTAKKKTGWGAGGCGKSSTDSDVHKNKNLHVKEAEDTTDPTCPIMHLCVQGSLSAGQQPWLCVCEGVSFNVPNRWQQWANSLKKKRREEDVWNCGKWWHRNKDGHGKTTREFLLLPSRQSRRLIVYVFYASTTGRVSACEQLQSGP